MKRPSADLAAEHQPRVLLLSPEAPYPAVGGGALRTASLVEYFGRRSALDLILFRQPGAPDPSRDIPPGLVNSFTVVDLPHHSKSPLARSLRNSRRFLRGVPPLLDRYSGFADEMQRFLRGKNYNLAVLEHFWCAPYLEILRPVARRTVLDLHNIESQLSITSSAAARWPASAMLAQFSRAYLRLERQWVPQFDMVLAASQDDAALANKIVPASHVHVYPNALPDHPLPAAREGHSIVFTGNLEYAPNIGAVEYFHKDVWPGLRRQWPDLAWRVAGRNPQAVADLLAGSPGVHLIGPVDDALAILAQSKVAIVPLRAGSGTRFKILEAWAAGRAVVSTSIGAEGLGACDGEHLLIADGPAAFANAISALLESPELRAKLGAAGRALYLDRYTWQSAWRILDSLALLT